MFKELVQGKESEMTMYADLPDHQIIGGTIPADILTTSQRPDIVLISRTYKKLVLLELSVSFEKNIESANIRKSLRFRELTEDSRNKGWDTYNIPFEVGSRGLVTRKNKNYVSEL